MRGDEEPRGMSDGKHDYSPRWAAEGKWLVFVRTPETPSGPSTGPASRPPASQLYMLPMNGGESWKFTDLPRAAGSPVRSPDGKLIAFTTETSPDDLAKQTKQDANTESQPAASKALHT